MYPKFFYSFSEPRLIGHAHYDIRVKRYVFHPLIVGVLREVYTSIIGDTVEELYRHDKFPNKPDISEVLSEFDATFNDTEGYGQRLSAFYHVSNGSLIYFTLQDWLKI